MVAAVLTFGPWSEPSSLTNVDNAELARRVDVANAKERAKWEAVVAAAKSRRPIADSTEGDGKSAGDVAFTSLLSLVDKLVEETPTLDLGEGVEIESMEVVPPPPPAVDALDEEESSPPSSANTSASESNSEVDPVVFDWRTVVEVNETIADVSLFIPSGLEDASIDPTKAPASSRASSGFFIDQGAFGFPSSETTDISSPLVSWVVSEAIDSQQLLLSSLSTGTAAVQTSTAVNGIVLREGEGGEGGVAILHLERTSSFFGSVVVQLRALYSDDKDSAFADGADTATAISNGIGGAAPQGAVAGLDFRLDADIGLASVDAYPTDTTTVGYDLRYSSGQQLNHTIKVTALDDPNPMYNSVQGGGYRFGPLSAMDRKLHLCVVGASGGGRGRDGHDCATVYIEDRAKPPLLTLADGVARHVAAPGELGVLMVLRRHTYVQAGMAIDHTASSGGRLVVRGNRNSKAWIENSSSWLAFPDATITATEAVGQDQQRYMEAKEAPLVIHVAADDEDAAEPQRFSSGDDDVVVQNGDRIARHCSVIELGTVTLTNVLGALQVGTPGQRNNGDLQVAVSYVPDRECARGVFASFDLTGTGTSSSAIEQALAQQFVAALEEQLSTMLAQTEPGDTSVRLLRAHRTGSEAGSVFSIQADVALIAAPTADSSGSPTSYLENSLAVQSKLSMLSDTGFAATIALANTMEGSLQLTAAVLSSTKAPELAVSRLMARCAGACEGCIWGEPHVCTACAAPNEVLTSSGRCEGPNTMRQGDGALSITSDAAAVGAGVGILVMLIAIAVMLTVRKKRRDAAAAALGPEMARAGKLDAGSSFYVDSSGKTVGDGDLEANEGSDKPQASTYLYSIFAGAFVAKPSAAAPVARNATKGGMARAGNLDAGTSFVMDLSGPSGMSRAGVQRTATIGDAEDLGTVREVRGLSLGLEPEELKQGSKARERSDSVVETVDPEGNTYYYNKYTAKVGWHPEEVTRSARTELTMDGGDGRERVESVQSKIDPASGKEYFYNTHTQKTGWSADGLSRNEVNKSYGISSAGKREDGDGGFVLSNPMFANPTKPGRKGEQQQRVTEKSKKGRATEEKEEKKEKGQNDQARKKRIEKGKTSGKRRTWAPMNGTDDDGPSLHQQCEQQKEKKQAKAGLMSIKSTVAMS
jgi:hypothetical protein